MLRKREPVYQALWAGPCDFDEVLISPVMIQDHMPDNMLRALNKVRPDAVVRQQAKRSQAPLSRTPSVKPGHYEPLEETTDGPDVPSEVIQRDRAAKNVDNQTVNNYDRACARPGIDDCTSIIVDVEIHECKETLPNSHWLWQLVFYRRSFRLFSVMRLHDWKSPWLNIKKVIKYQKKE